MALTKRNLADLIRDKMLGGDATLSGKLHPTIIYKTADTIIGKLIEQAQFKDIDSNGYEINGEFITVFKNIEVKEDQDTGERYSDLPAPLISLKDDRGLVRVSDMRDIENAYAIVGNGSHDVFSVLDAHQLNTKPEVYVQGNQIRYRNLRVSVEKVLIKMIAGIDSLDADAPIPIPASLEADFVNMVTQMLADEKMTPQDKYNDNNANIPTG